MTISSPVIQANNNLLADIKTNFMGAYDIDTSGILKAVLDCVQQVPMERRQDRFFYYKTVPLPERIEYNQDVSFGTVEQEAWTIDAYKYGKALAWLEDDAKDDLTNSLPDRARKLGDAMKYLPVRIFFQILQAASNPLLLGTSVPSAPDGLALYSSSTRFGNSSGNIVTGSGTTAAAVTDDFFSTMERFASFLHTDGDTPLLSEEDLQDVVIFHPVGMMQAFKEAFVRTAVANASSVFEGSNSIVESGFNIKTYATPYLTDADDWYIFLPRVNQSIVFGQREGLQTREFNSANSATLAKSFRSFFMAWERQGWVPNLPYGTCKVSQ